MYTCAIITISDKGSRGERIDETGPALKNFLDQNGFDVKSVTIIPDELEEIQTKLRHFSDKEEVNLILTNGGTGFSARDVTPEATSSIIERQIPGFAEVMRLRSLEITPKAMLSRAVSGIRGKSIIVNLPGSPKGALENLKFIFEAIPHGIDILIGSASECANQEKSPRP